MKGDTIFDDPAIVELALGENKIFGSATFAIGLQTVSTDFDDYRLVVGPGQRIASIFLASSVRDEGTGLFETIIWNLGDISFPTVSTSVQGVEPFAAHLPLGEGTYTLNTNGYNGSFTEPGYRTADYAFTINVAAVPLPAGVVLLAGGLGLLALAGRRRQA